VRPLGCLQIDQKFMVKIIGKVITLSNGSRQLLMKAETQRDATEWADALVTFYRATPRRIPQPFEAHFPPRLQTSIKLYCCGKDYFSALAMALLQAQEEILLASWMVSPTLLLTRPPFAPLRLDQILKRKADQGVKIFILLYKEV
jgi:phospholipase D1/2